MPEQPNIILIVMDSVRADHVHSYGYPRRTTPFLDALAADGTRFEQAIAPAYWTLPSHASLFTGLYPSEHGAVKAGLTLPESIGPTMAEGLAEAGYETFAVSRNPNISRATKLSRGFRVFHDSWRGKRRPRALRVLGRAHRLLGFGDDGAAGTLQCARDFVRSARRPFFLFLLFMDTHYPYFARWRSPAGVLHPLRALRMLPVYARFARTANWGAIMRRHSHLRDQLIDLYDAELRYLDRRIEQFLHPLTIGSGEQDTVAIVTSDHGEGLGDHGLMSHGASTYDSQARIPLIVHARGILPSGATVPAQVQLTDVWPSLARRLGRPTAAEHWADRRPDIFNVHSMDDSNWPACVETAPDEGLTAFRHDGYKYIEKPDGSELYDLGEDPHELDDLAAAQPDTLADMARKLAEWRQNLRPYSGPAATAEDEEFVAQLKALGYL